MCDWLKKLSNRVLPMVLALVCLTISEGPVAQAHLFILRLIEFQHQFISCQTFALAVRTFRLHVNVEFAPKP